MTNNTKYKTIGKQARKPWITKGIRISSQNLRNLNLKTKLTSNQSLLEYYKKYKSIYKKVIKEAKRQHYTKRINNSRNKSKSAWKIINFETVTQLFLLGISFVLKHKKHNAL